MQNLADKTRSNDERLLTGGGEAGSAFWWRQA